MTPQISQFFWQLAKVNLHHDKVAKRERKSRPKTGMLGVNLNGTCFVENKNSPRLYWGAFAQGDDYTQAVEEAHRRFQAILLCDAFESTQAFLFLLLLTQTSTIHDCDAVLPSHKQVKNLITQLADFGFAVYYSASKEFQMKLDVRTS